MRLLIYYYYGIILLLTIIVMAQVYEIYSFDYDHAAGTVAVEAEVEDSVLAFPATQYEPEQWTHGRCETTIIWDVEDEVFGPLSREGLLKHFNECDYDDWTLIPFEEEEPSAPLSPFRTVFGYWNA
tara:strand:+ start:648 stop:1025 length:378 start_codon:yes stop_codon:yes gene_type:complete